MSFCVFFVYNQYIKDLFTSFNHFFQYLDPDCDKLNYYSRIFHKKKECPIMIVPDEGKCWNLFKQF